MSQNVWLSLLILVLTLGGLVIKAATTPRTADGPGSVSVLSVRRPREIRSAARAFFAEGGWAPAEAPSPREMSVAFAYQLGPRGPALALLFALGVLPGLVALALGRKTLTVTVAAREDAGGSATLVSWSAAAAEPPCRDFASMIRSQEPNITPDRLPRRRRLQSERRGRRSTARVEGPHADEQRPAGG